MAKPLLPSKIPADRHGEMAKAQAACQDNLLSSLYLWTPNTFLHLVTNSGHHGVALNEHRLITVKISEPTCSDSGMYSPGALYNPANANRQK
jgi:hypothetical protein